MRPVTARGFRDVLPVEAAERECVRDRVSAVFSAWGYEPIETPAVEVYETLELGAGDLEGTAFRMLDADGRLLALRPDMTVGIARLVTSRFGSDAWPLRFRYAAEVFREQESLRGQARQFTQLGVEFVGASGPAADAEAVSMLVESIAAAGLDEFTVAIGDVAVLSAIVEQAGMDDAWRAAVLKAAHERNLVAIDSLSRSEGMDPVAGEALRKVVRIRGGADAIAACVEAVSRLELPDVLDDFSRTWRLIEAAGQFERVVVDFGVMRSFDYYTGLVLEAYAPGIGLPIGGGGRYDSVLASYGTVAPAVGFALGLERLIIALSEAKNTPNPEPVSAVVGGEAGAAFAEAANRRAKGERVVLAAGLAGDDLRRVAGRAGAKAVEAR